MVIIAAVGLSLNDVWFRTKKNCPICLNRILIYQICLVSKRILWKISQNYFLLQIKKITKKLNWNLSNSNKHIVGFYKLPDNRKLTLLVFLNSQWKNLKLKNFFFISNNFSNSFRMWEMENVPSVPNFRRSKVRERGRRWWWEKLKTC